MPLRQILLSAFVTLYSLLATPLSAAQIDVLDAHPEGCTAMLTGQITAGDADLLRARLIGPGERPLYFNVTVTLCLDSPGGSFLEGLAMARHMREAGIATHVPAGATCLSACALAFMGGSQLGFEDGITRRFSRSLHASARLGFHAPQLDIPSGQFSEFEVKQAFRLALKSSAIIFTRLEELGLSRTFALAFFDVPDGRFLAIDTPDLAQQAGVTVTGTGPLPRRISADRLAELCARTFRKFDLSVYDDEGYAAEVLHTDVIDLPPKFSDTQRTAHLQATTSEGLVEWNVCELDWRPDQQDTFWHVIQLTHHGIYDFHENEWENPPRLTRNDLLPRLDQQIVASASLMPLLAFPGDAVLADLGGGARTSARILTDAVSCAPVSRAYSVFRVQNFSNMRVAPGFDTQVLREVPRDARVTPLRHDLTATSLQSEACRVTCSPEAITPETAADIRQCATSNDVWWHVRTEDGTTGWMSSQFLSPTP